MKYFLPVAMLAMSVSTASATTIDLGMNFNDFDSALDVTAHGENVTFFDFGNGVTGRIEVFNRALFREDPALGRTNNGEARIFDTRLTGTSDDDLEGDFTNVADANDTRDFGKALIIQERASKASSNADDEAGGGTVTFFFDAAIDLLGLAYLDGEKGAIVTTGNHQLGDFGADVSGDHLFVELDFSTDALAFGLTEFTVDYQGSGALAGFNVRDAVPGAGPSVVPLPAALPLLLGAFGSLSLLRSRKRA